MPLEIVRNDITKMQVDAIVNTANQHPIVGGGVNFEKVCQLLAEDTFSTNHQRRHFTDDTVMTCAVAEAVMNGGERKDFIDAMKKYGRMYPDAGYGT